MQGRRLRINSAQIGTAGSTASPDGNHRRPRIEEVGSGLWRDDETLHIDSLAALDDYAQRLWLRWLHPPEKGSGGGQVAGPRHHALGVTEIGSGLLGFDNHNATAGRLRFVEVPADLYRAMGDDSGKRPDPAQSLAKQRLAATLTHADVISLCFGATEDWSKIDLAALRSVLIAIRRLRAKNAITNLVVSKAEVLLAEHSYPKRRAGFEPDALLSERYARKVVLERFHDDGLWRLAHETPGLRFRIASSFGLLTASGSYNVDLVRDDRPFRIAADPQCLRPLWPRRDANARLLLPSVPETLERWRPIGAVEALLDCEPLLDRRHYKRADDHH